MNKSKHNDILLVEPDIILAKTYTQSLKNVGYQVDYIGGAQQAITAIDKAKPKLIIMELQLKTHNGIELLYELRSYPDTMQMPIILLTFVPESIIQNLKKQFNIVAYLYKPQTSLEKLLKTVEEAISV